MQEKAFKDLKVDEVVVVSGRNVKIVSAHFCDGSNEPLQFVGGKNLKTCAALRVFFSDGSNDIVHPDMKILTGVLN